MPRVCPNCHRESPVEADYCPACGAPMDEHVYQGEMKRAMGALADPPMKWHKFLIWISLPVGMLIQLFNLIQVARALAAFDPAQIVPEYLEIARFSLYLDLGATFCLLPLCLATEISLARMKWRGVRLLLGVYLFQIVYSAITLMLLIRIQGSGFDVILSLIELILFFFLSRIYYRKRRALFD